MDNKDVEGALNWLTNFTSELANALVIFLEMVPDVIKGAVVCILVLVWVWKLVKRG